MADTNREAELARAAEELHGATSALREIMDSFLRGSHDEQPWKDSDDIGRPRRKVRVSPGGEDQPEPRSPFLAGSGDPTLAERFEDELNGAACP